jgi:hypothetical protein
MYCSLTLKSWVIWSSHTQSKHKYQKEKPSTYNVSQQVDEHIPYAKFALEMRKFNNNNKIIVDNLLHKKQQYS